MRVNIELAGRPRGKGRARATVQNGRARVYPDGKTVKYESQLRYAAQQTMAGRLPTAQPVRVHVEVVLQPAQSGSKADRAIDLANGPIKRNSGDVDNYLKILDALNGIIWLDDSQIVEAHVLKVYGPAPTLRIAVETIEPAPTAVVKSSGAPAGDLFAGAPA